MIWIKIIKKIIKLLHSDISPKQIALAAALGSIIGLTPISAMHNYFILLLILMLNVNIGAAFISMGLFKIIGFALDPLADALGYWLLVDLKNLDSLWTSLYNMPIVPFTRFNNTVVLGSLVISLILFVPIKIFAEKFIVYYRSNLQNKVENMKIVKLLKFSKIYKIYDKYR